MHSQKKIQTNVRKNERSNSVEDFSCSSKIRVWFHTCVSTLRPLHI